MTRPKFRRSLRFDSLESRQLLSGTATAPTAEQQYMLEMVNDARTNPAATADWLRSSITPDVQATLNYYHVDLNATLQAISSTPAKPPLAWSTNLANAAQAHSQDMANTKVQSHTGSDGSTINSRIQQSGYGQVASAGENAYAYAGDVKQAMEAFLLDWGVSDQGHRRNLLQANVPNNQAFQDVGIGIIHTNDPSFGPVVVTQDFARPANGQAELLGVAYSDNQGTGRYSPGEGQGGVRVDVTNIDTGAGYTTQTSDAGGYQIPLPAGRYQVTASVNDKVIQTSRVDLGSENVKIDFVLTNPRDGRNRQDVINSVLPAPAPAPAPMAATVAPAPAPVSVPVTLAAQASTVAPTSFGGWTSWKANQV
jgi:uncharacterized protein YkwD